MWANWMEYIHSQSLSKTPIDKIDPAKTREFGTWLRNKPKLGYKGKPRSVAAILRRPKINIKNIPRGAYQHPSTCASMAQQEEEILIEAESTIKYEGYIKLITSHNPTTSKNNHKTSNTSDAF